MLGLRLFVFVLFSGLIVPAHAHSTVSAKSALHRTVSPVTASSKKVKVKAKHTPVVSHNKTRKPRHSKRLATVHSVAAGLALEESGSIPSGRVMSAGYTAGASDGVIVPAGLKSNAVLVMDHSSGEVLYGRNVDRVLPIASITKLMTALVLLEDHEDIDLEEIISISEMDTHLAKSSKSHLQPGMVFSRRDLILLALMSSENRAAHALARSSPSGLSLFIEKMNRKARILGMRGTHFVEPTGLSSQNVSTAQDLAKLVAAAYRVPLIRESSTTANRMLMLGSRPYQFNNTNALVRAGQWNIGISKTGYISEAGRCLVMQTKVGARPVIMVLLDSDGKFTRVADAQRIRRWMEGQHYNQESQSPPHNRHAHDA